MTGMLLKPRAYAWIIPLSVVLGGILWICAMGASPFPLESPCSTEAACDHDFPLYCQVFYGAFAVGPVLIAVLLWLRARAYQRKAVS